MDFFPFVSFQCSPGIALEVFKGPYLILTIVVNFERFCKMTWNVIFN